MPNLTTRRDVLRGGALLAASSTLPALADAGQAFAQTGSAKGNLRPSPVRLGVASYSLRNLDPMAVIAAMKQLRTPFLNLKDTHLPMTPLDQVATRAAAYRAAGLTLTAAGTIYFNKDEDEDVRAKFEYCKAAGISLMVAAPTHVTLPRVERFAKQYDMRVAIHNHGPEDKEWPSPLDVLAAVKNLDPRMGCCIDVGHAMRAGTDVVEAIHKAGPRLFDMHMKDLASPTAKESQVAVGEGVMPVRAIFEALIAMRYPGYVDLEYEIKPEDPLPGMVESFAYMRGVLNGMGYTTAA
ncbi:MAG: sugar phosphate isomerase/epimerase family protein [Janthinobacterium lividum]